MTLTPGRFLGKRYRIIKQLGQGSMATVYLAEDPRFERQVAIKVLPTELLNDSTFRARFDREAKTIAALQHPAIVPVYDFGEQYSQPFLVMAYMAGGSLEDRIKQKSFSLEEAVRLLSILTPALDQAHASGVVHRDIKPSNILFDRHGNPYISDFGIVKLTQASTTLTSTTIVGTPAYMSPEQGLGEADIDGRSDVYSLGALLFQLLSGKLPYESATPTGMIIRHINDPIPNILDVKPDLPPGCQKVIARAMAKRREERYSTVSDMAKALAAITTASAPKAVTATEVATPAQPPKGPPSPPSPEATIYPTVGQPIPQRQPAGPATAYAPLPSRRRPRWNWIITGIGLLIFMVCIIAAISGGFAYLQFTHLSATRTALAQEIILGTGLGSPTTVSPPTTSAPLPITETSTPVLPTPTSTPITSTKPPTNTPTPEPPTITPTPTPTPVTPTKTPTRTKTNPPPPTGVKGKIVYTCEVIRGSDVFDQICMINADGTDQRQVTDVDGSAYYPALSPDGNSIVFVSNMSGDHEIYELDLDTNKYVQLTTGLGDPTSPRISPDGKLIIFTNVKNNVSSLFLMNRDGSHIRKMDTGGGLRPTWSPDGSQLSFYNESDGQIYVVDKDGNNAHKITSVDDAGAGTSWSSDGARIAFFRGGSGNHQIFVMDVNGSNIQQVTTDGDNLSPTFAPYGDWIGFLCYKPEAQSSKEGELCIIRMDGTGLHQLTNNNLLDWLPYWGP